MGLRKRINYLLFIAGITTLAGAAFGQELWTWEDDIQSYNSQPVYPPSYNQAGKPGVRFRNSLTIGTDGKIWMYGGGNTFGNTSWYNDLWQFDNISKQWFWRSGSNILNDSGVTPSPTDPEQIGRPSARRRPTMWTDSSNNLWFLGGFLAPNYLNDLWKYNTATSKWQLISQGTASPSYPANYGENGIPGGRELGTVWDTENAFYLFGGFGKAASNTGFLNDLWKFDKTTKTWTWLAGSSNVQQDSVLTGNELSPGSRQNALGYFDNQNNLCLWSGEKYHSSLNFPQANDLWKYNLTTGWALISNDVGLENAENYPTNYNEVGSPGSRLAPRFHHDPINNTIYLFGGTIPNPGQRKDDLWKYSLNANNWTWVSGNKTLPASDSYTYPPAVGQNGTPYSYIFYSTASDSNRIWLYTSSNSVAQSDDLWSFNYPVEASVREWSLYE